ncbi:zinc finger CCCH domain-containing protein 10-like isoform X1 [Chiloscyllium plagiosum]|uniref:zinc finger CCCH domain-containing protein 10-like isoform X1 n=1 Tax=Chiloscyllium plagiosum TaxID=36176 RepID=UPI001CB7F077|nr:zinc finger CCCH domain-containing protein 10-like isoform X1 [Chiloscyllium plagiosum]XP_043537838.1 zinc finger CCCH domain-containing protein 10-like isoform X1 [Chiloscyllium plagiosum]XP_043537839.1 zinc finger CCCH domain-containing protein 10-like isoform X1 [Chiloscyllium plagiosum]XP_043537840.1 zinc finger CCCH domain-containing protein 10-like isoform X1 [Chiloscyllium plagiosum]XP_043537842.1 zinc finger CCCH domain-containing protein 10-like isoform X1 [Chiloscyllium plagiosum]
MSENDTDNLVNSGKYEAGKSKRNVCRDFLRNVCNRGKNCRYFHPDDIEASDLAEIRNETDNLVNIASDEAGKSKQNICRDFLRNLCNRGKNCRYIHPDDIEASDLTDVRNDTDNLVNIGNDEAGKSKQNICRDFLRNLCNRGKNCRYFHPDDIEVTNHTDLSDDADNLVNNSKYEVSKSKRNVCRDFLRNVCNRGKNCRYFHPDNVEAYNVGDMRHESIFCQYFQNSKCTRENCTFIHGTKGEENYYNKTGKLPAHLQQTVAVTFGLSPSNLPLITKEIPFCRDFLKGKCRRGSKCKFQHLKRDDNDKKSVERVSSQDRELSPEICRYDRLDDLYETERCDYDQHPKRRRVEGLRFEVFDYSTPSLRPGELSFLEEENHMLRKRNEELKKQVSSLMLTNEVLLEQNADLRKQVKLGILNTGADPTQHPALHTVTNYNRSIVKTHTTLSNQTLRSQPISHQELIAQARAHNALCSEATSQSPPCLSASISAPYVQGMTSPVSMAPLAISTPVAVTQSLPGIAMSYTTTQMVSYPNASQSMRFLCRAEES